MNIGTQVIIQSAQNCYKVYRGRIGVVVDFNEIENYYLVWSNGTTIRLREEEMSLLEAPKEEVAVKFEVTPENVELFNKWEPAAKFNEEFGAEFVPNENSDNPGIISPGILDIANKIENESVSEAPQPPVKKRGRPAKIQLAPVEVE